MSRLTDLTAVVRLACFTEDRTAEEQHAMLNVAMHVDSERSAFMRWNTDLAPPMLTPDVIDTYDPSAGRAVHLSAAQRKKFDRMAEKWSTCLVCRCPLGVHGAPGDEYHRKPTDIDFGWWNR